MVWCHPALYQPASILHCANLQGCCAADLVRALACAREGRETRGPRVIRYPMPAYAGAGAGAVDRAREVPLKRWRLQTHAHRKGARPS